MENHSGEPGVPARQHGQNAVAPRKIINPKELSVIWISVPPVPVHALLTGVQLNKSTVLMVLGLVALVGVVFVAVPGVIVLVVFVVIPLVVIALPVVVVSVVLRTGCCHHGNRCSQSAS